MAPVRCLFTTLTGMALAGALAACQDAASPQPPPRVPKPKIEQEAIDPVRPGPAAKPQTREV